MFEVQILIPVADNDGNAFPPEHHGDFEAVLLDRFGGFTRYPVEAVGGWRNAAGTVFADRTRLYAVAVVTIADGAKVADVAEVAKRHYRQEAIYIRYLGQSEVL